MATVPERGGPRLSAETQALTAPVDAVIEAATRRTTLRDLVAEGEAAGLAPWSARSRPLIQAQLNPRYRQHLDWPEEWYIHVPGTGVTWRPRAAARAGYPRIQLRAFPSAAEAEAAAQAEWRRYWTQDRKRVLGDDSVISPDVWAEFTVQWNNPADLAALAAWRPKDGHLPLATILRTRDVPASVIGAPVPRRGLDADRGFAMDDWRAQDDALAESDAVWRARAATRPAAETVEPWAHPVAQQWLRTTADVLKVLQDQPAAAAVQAALDAVHTAEHPEMTVRHLWGDV